MSELKLRPPGGKVLQSLRKEPPSPTGKSNATRKECFDIA